MPSAAKTFAPGYRFTLIGFAAIFAAPTLAIMIGLAAGFFSLPRDSVPAPVVRAVAVRPVAAVSPLSPGERRIAAGRTCRPDL
jgi:hypothetical protein